MAHAIKRTSPTGKGSKFIGTCLKCGEEGLSIQAAQKDCPKDDEISDEAVLLDILKEYSK